METLMWLAVAGVVMVVGKKIGKYLWPEDWENNASGVAWEKSEQLEIPFGSE